MEKGLESFFSCSARAPWVGALEPPVVDGPAARCSRVSLPQQSVWPCNDGEGWLVLRVLVMARALLVGALEPLMMVGSGTWATSPSPLLPPDERLQAPVEEGTSTRST